MVGAPNRTNTGTAGGGLSLDEARSHMGLWVALASPLILSIDVTNPISPEILGILTNPHVLSVHKDRLARQGMPIPAAFAGRTALRRTEGYTAPTINDPVLAIAKPLANKGTALLVVNRGDTTQPGVIVAFDDMHTWPENPAPALSQTVYDLWNGPSTVHSASCCLRLPPLAAHASRFLRLAPAKATNEQPGACDKYRSDFKLCTLID